MQASGWSIINQTGLSGKKSSQIKKKKKLIIEKILLNFYRINSFFFLFFLYHRFDPRVCKVGFQSTIKIINFENI